jgi:hypothetical protein
MSLNKNRRSDTMKATLFSVSGLALLFATSFVGCDKTLSDEELAARSVGSPVRVGVDLPARVNLEANLTCSNNPGPYITLEGGLVWEDSLTARMTFRNNEKGTHEHSEDVSVNVSLLAAGDSITIPKQPSRGGAGGNPFIWIQMVDDAGDALSDEIYLGRCVQGLTTLNPDVLMPALATLVIESLDCTNNPGPFIRVGGDLNLESGLHARVIFRNNDNPVGGPHETVVEEAFNVQLLAPGLNIEFPKQPVHGGVGGNPWIWVQLLSNSGALSEEILVGRCVQLQPGN